MKLLIDESLQRRVVDLLAEAGHDALHAADVDLLGAPDDRVLAAAAEDDRVLVTADTDSGTLLALSGDLYPSVILLRRPGRRPEQRAAAILRTIESVHERLDAEAMVVAEPHRIRIRNLPIGSA